MIPKPITYHLWKYPEEVPLLWENILFPIVRRVAAQVMNADLVAVQPMGEPNPILYAPIIYGYWEPKSIIDRIEKPKSYLEWKKYKKILGNYIHIKHKVIYNLLILR